MADDDFDREIPSNAIWHARFEAEVWEWRGPAPYFFVSLPHDLGEEINELSKVVTYGWGMIPVTVQIGRTVWTTAMFAKDETYAVPLRTKERKAEGVGLGDVVDISVTLLDS